MDYMIWNIYQGFTRNWIEVLSFLSNKSWKQQYFIMKTLSIGLMNAYKA